ncbi:MAG: GntR family transcriptional regulator [Chloroflexales bacterium]|nr:GntR family transcriptional regulator [Chloroflexales bacterium]
MMAEPFQPLTGKTLRTSVIDTIRQAILDGSLMPGEQVNQAHIAEKLGISRGPVREALGQLEQEGLIRNVPYKGTYVTEITREYIEELYSMRQVLEEFAIRRATVLIEPDELAELHAVVADMKAAADAEDSGRLGQLDIRFHALICQSARHHLLMQTWKALDVGVRRCLALRHRIYSDPRDIVGTHPDILAALEARDADRADELLSVHIQEAGEQLIKVWAANQQTVAIDTNAGVLSDQLF